jgi:hypothetical protein
MLKMATDWAPIRRHPPPILKPADVDRGQADSALPTIDVRDRLFIAIALSTSAARDESAVPNPASEFKPGPYAALHQLEQYEALAHDRRTLVADEPYALCNSSGLVTRVDAAQQPQQQSRLRRGHTLFKMTAFSADDTQDGLSSTRERSHRRPACTRRAADAQVEFKRAVVICAPSTAAKQATVTRTRHAPILSQRECHWRSLFNDLMRAACAQASMLSSVRLRTHLRAALYDHTTPGMARGGRAIVQLNAHRVPCPGVL